MTEARIRELCLTFPGTTVEILWVNDLVFKVAGKMFACWGLESLAFSFKCPEETFWELTELPGVDPAPYLARAHWVLIEPATCQLDSKEIDRLIRQSYDLVVARLPKKIQKTLG